MKSSELSPLLFTVYLAAASGRSPALPCFAAFLVLVRFSGLFVFTQFFFQTHSTDLCLGLSCLISANNFHPLLSTAGGDLIMMRGGLADTFLCQVSMYLMPLAFAYSIA